MLQKTQKEKIELALIGGGGVFLNDNRFSTTNTDLHEGLFSAALVGLIDLLDIPERHFCGAEPDAARHRPGS